MKKIVGLLAVLIVIVLGALAFMSVANNPKNKIVGEWVNESNKYSLNFLKNGDVNLPVEYFTDYEGDTLGKYSINKKDKRVTFTFSYFNAEYSETRDYKIEGDSLTLIKKPEDEGDSLLFVNDYAQDEITVFSRKKSD